MRSIENGTNNMLGLNANIKFTPMNFMLGYLNRDQHSVPINTLFMAAKQYIFDCAYQQTKLYPRIFRDRFYRIFEEEQLLYTLNFKTETLKRHWHR